MKEEQPTAPLSDKEAARPGEKKSVKGRKPDTPKNTYPSNKGCEDDHYCDCILKALAEHSSLTKQDILELLRKKLPNTLDEDQKYSKAGNLLTKLRKENKIGNVSKGTQSHWYLKVDHPEKKRYEYT